MTGLQLQEMIPGHGQTSASKLLCHKISKVFSTCAPPRYFLKFENFLPHSEYPDVDHTLRGTGGPVKVGYNSHITEASKAFIKACVGVGIPFTHDFNGPLSTLGVSRVSFLSTRLS